MLSIIQQTQAVDDWYRQAKIYQYGTREQQLAKFYRTLGDVAEGVQKMDNLKVAAAMGRSLWAFVGLLHFGKHTNVGDFVIPLDAAIKDHTTGNTKEFRLHNLFVVATEVVGLILQDEHEPHSYVTELHSLARQYRMLARICGLEFGRVIYNGHRVLINTKGEMNGIGLFVPASDDFTGDKLPGSRQMSGPAICLMFQTVLDSCVATHLAPYCHRPFKRDELPTINAALATTLNELLDKYVRDSVRWNHILFERVPEITAAYTDGGVNVVMNDDLLYLFESLKRDSI